MTVEAPDIVIAPPVTTSGKRLARPRAMARYLVMAVITLVLISFIAFAAMNRSATEAARNALGRGATGEQLRTYVAAHRLDRPLVVRYLDWLGHYLRGEWGSTVTSNLSVRTLVLPAFRHTAELALASLLWSLPVAIALGVFMARRGGVIDRGLLVIMTVLAALPEFVVGLAVMILLAVQLRWFPIASGAVTGPFTQDWLKAFALPALTLGLGVIPYVSRIARAAVSESLGAPFTRNAVLRGLPRRRVVWRHAMRSAAVPLVNAIAINIIYLMGGVVIVENVFAFPGLGRLLIQAIGQGDTNLALSIIVLLGAVFIALGLVADVVVTYLNPRLKAV